MTKKMRNKETILMAIITLSLGFILGITITALDSNTALRNRDAIN